MAARSAWACLRRAAPQTLFPGSEGPASDIRCPTQRFSQASAASASPRPAKLTDIDLLLIDGYLVKSLKVEGIALPEANIACATTFGRVVVAHEVGHCLGATHEDAALYRDTEFNDPNHCATFMATQRPEWTCALFGYSAENRYNIHNYLKDAP